MANSSFSSTKSASSNLPCRELLFGEIDSTGVPSLRTNNSICNLILTSSSPFLRFWLVDNVRDSFFSYFAQEELLELRLVCHDWSSRIAATAFRDLNIAFRASTFTRPSRVAALERIGHHARTLKLSLPRTSDTFLPPLINPHTGEETTFNYTPQVHSTAKSAKYDSQEVTDLLVKQYPPLFHASTNVPAFIRAFSALPNLLHLKISSPLQDSRSADRRTTVDYALISLRMAIERAPLHHLDALSFLPIHSSGLFYMQPLLGIGASPKSLKRWAQIRKMDIEMESADKDRGARSDQLKTLHSYLRGFAPTLTQFHFCWRGAKGPSPISLDSEPCVSSHPTSSKHVEDSEKQSGAQAHGQKSSKSKGLTALKFTALHHMELENAVMDATQISAFICNHKRTLEDFKFESIRLRSGNWDDALKPLAVDLRRSEMKRHGKKKTDSMASMDVPLMLSPANMSELVVGKMGEDVAGADVDLDETPKTPKFPKARERGAASALSRWLSKRTAARAREKAKEQLLGGSEHVRSKLKNSVLSWRS